MTTMEIYVKVVIVDHPTQKDKVGDNGLYVESATAIDKDELIEENEKMRKQLNEWAPLMAAHGFIETQTK